MGFSFLIASKDYFLTYLSFSEYLRNCGVLALEALALSCIDASSGKAWRHIGVFMPILRFAVSGGKSIE